MSHQILGIGNAIVDVISQCDDDFLARQQIDKGVMSLIDEARGEALYDAMENRTQAAGGSVANTIAGLGALGLKTGFIGRVNDDALGQYYADAMTDAGTDFVNPPAAGDAPTSRSMIFVSPDGERSMNTYLGISTDLGADDVDTSVAGAAQILLLEGYLYDKPTGKEAFLTAARATQSGGGLAGISLSDPFCVDRHRDDFRTLIPELSYVIGNHEEWQSMYQTDDLDSALTAAAAENPLVVCTRSGDGISIMDKGQRIDINVDKIKPLDTTGAGDQFAAGFLYGVATGASLETAGRMGAISAAEVITHYGARPEQDVMALFQKAGLV